jgi:5-methylcytosine-specific restriction endonuclease McrA
MTAVSRTGRPWRRKVARVIRRDGGICHLCGGPDADSADHLVPWAISQDDSLSNLAAVHHNVPPKCNMIRGTRPIEEARAEIAAMLQPSGPSDWDW